MYHHEDAEKENVSPLQAFPFRVALGIALFLVKDLALRQLLSLTCAMAYPPAGGDRITL
ncbi:hypothetical protein [Nostoc sp.]|uniref:hypothetical protein n=1 Tax=Nostoc sp. TaxID=1180 RepID=UPI002FF662BD